MTSFPDLTALINIPAIRINSITINGVGEVIIEAESTLEGTLCHRCGGKITPPHGHDRPLKLRHLPICGRETYIVIRLPRYRCSRCPGKPTTTQRVSWRHNQSMHTRAFEERVLLSVINSTVGDASIREAVGYDAVLGIIDRYIAKDVNWDEFDRLDVLGLDEIALKKGHQDYVTIVTARRGDETVILGVLADREKATVKAFLATIPKRLRRTLRAVCCDMYQGFVNAAKEVLGRRVKIIIDRFHVARLYRKGLDTLRKQELKRLKRELSEAAYQELKGAMWVLRKRKTALTEEEQQLLRRLFGHSPLLESAYGLSEALTATFDKRIQKESARKAIKRWMARVKASGLKCFDTFLKTLAGSINEVLNYFIDRQTSGFVEGLNNKIKVIKRRCYGIFNVKRLFQRIHLDLSGYELFA